MSAEQRPETGQPAVNIAAADPGHGPVRIAKAVDGPGSTADRLRRRRLIVTLVVSLLLITAVVVGLAAYGVVQMVRFIERQQQPRLLTSLNPPATITIPGGWSEVTDLAAEAVFQARSADQETYLIVTETPKQDLEDGMTLDGFADLSLEWTREGLADPKIGEGAHMDLSGRSFIQHKIEGLVDQQKSVILQAVTEDATRFYCIQLGTPPSEYLEMSGDMERMVATFKLPDAGQP
ncbi:MAG: hypothetical protein ACO1SX_21975 [Actinomycetota bacterium]